MTGLASSHPELARRYERLVELVWSHGWEVWIGSSTRSRATQEDLYERWHAGTYRVPSVANPNADGGPSPWGWHWLGSYHMPQADGYSHALDLGWRGCSNAEFFDLAASCGLVRTVRSENWHYQWVHRNVVFHAPALAQDDEPVTETDDEGDIEMWLWTHEGVSYKAAPGFVQSLYNIPGLAILNMAKGVPNYGEVDRATHDLLFFRALGMRDDGSLDVGTQGSWFRG